MPICASLKVQNRSRTRHWNRWSLCKFCGSPNRMWLRRSPSSPSLPQKSTRSIPSSAQIAMVSASSDAPFTREEWLAILPVAAADPPDVFAAGDEEEGAKEPAPPAVPLDEAAAATARFSPLLALMARALEWLRKPVRNSLLGDISFAVHRLGALVLLAALPAYASPWITLPSGPFAAGMIAHALSSLPTLFFLLYQSLRVRPRWADQDTVPHWARQISRWASLLPTVAGVCSAPSSLVEHSARDDQLCSCPGTSCAGKLPGQAAASYLFLNILKVTIVLFLCPATLWTPLVTLGPVVWATWWGALVGALLCALVLVSVPVIVFRNASISNERMTQLSLRIQRRAATIVIGQLIRTARDDPESLAGLGSENGASSAYVAFHRRLAGLWSQGPLAYLHSFARNLAFVTLPCLVLGLILNSAVGSCFTAWQLIVLFYNSWLSFSYLFDIAAANARVAAVADVFDSGRSALLRLLVQRPGMPPAAAAAIRDHAALLGCLAAEAPLARWLGLTVTWGLVRTLAVTALTALGALWGIVRGLGVTVTMESMCGIQKLG